MSINNQLVLSYLNSAVTEAEVENSKKYNLDLTIVKIEIKESEPKKFKDILKFINTYFDFPSMVHDSNYSYLIFLKNIKLHTAVLMVKNLNLALKLNFAYKLINVAVTNLDKDDTTSDILERLNKYYMKSKLSNQELYYGTRILDFNDNDMQTITSILSNERHLSMYGLFKEAPIKIEAISEVIDKNHSIFKVPREYITFIQKQPIVYFEHNDIPGIFTASILNCNFENNNVEVGEFKFIDNSPIHRKNLRVAPISPVKASIGHDDFVINGFISDISSNSILFTTELTNIDQLKEEALLNKTFKLMFDLDIYRNNFEISVKATIFKDKGNQLILNIFTDSDTKKIINEYINMCYQQLLLQLQGKVV